MLEVGAILYFTPFHFRNGNPPKNKYFIVLSVCDNDLIVASLPTSKDHVPSHLTKKHGCINDEPSRFNCYCFKKSVVISKCKTFSFKLDTFIYGEQVDVIDATSLMKQYPDEGKNYKKCGVLSEEELTRLKKCLIKSGKVKNKIKRLLRNN